LQRCNGKFLFNKFASPVLAIHGELRTRIYVETQQAIFMLESVTDALPELVLGDDGFPMTGDDGLPLTI
jgi:hypothetical protein